MKTWKPFKKYPKVKVTYKSSNPSVVSISKNGKLKIRKKGYSLLNGIPPDGVRSERETGIYYIPKNG